MTTDTMNIGGALTDVDAQSLLDLEKLDGAQETTFAHALQRLLDDSDAAPVARFQSRI